MRGAMQQFCIRVGGFVAVTLALFLGSSSVAKAQAAGGGGLSWLAFSDTYFLEGNHNPHGAPEFARHRDNVRFNRFGINCLGVYAKYHGNRFGAKVKLTPYPGCPPLKAYGIWVPTPGMEITFGKFPTIYGIEAVESWENFNYTRGAVAVLAQPDAFAGLRVEYRATQAFSLNLIATNGPDLAHDNNKEITFGAQAVIQPSPYFTLRAGYLGGPEEPPLVNLRENAGTPNEMEHTVNNVGFADRWTHRADLVLEAALGTFALKLNGVYGIRSVSRVEFIPLNPADPTVGNEVIGPAVTESYYGFVAAGRLATSQSTALAVRAEYLNDPNFWLYPEVPERTVELGVEPHPMTVTTITFTLEYIPFPDVGNPVIRWDTRFELAANQIYFIGNAQHEISRDWWATILGVVVHLHG